MFYSDNYFNLEVSSNTLKSVCHGIIAGIPAPFNDIDVNGCDGLNPSCPVTAGTSYTYTASIPVKSIYPQVCNHQSSSVYIFHNPIYIHVHYGEMLGVWLILICCCL